MSRFSETLLEHARHPHNFGRAPSATVFGRADLNGQPPRVEIYLQITEGFIKNASYFAEGCGVTIAIGSAMTDLLREKSIQYAWELDAESLDRELDGIPSDKLFCLDVALRGLRAALSTMTGQ